MTELEFLPQPYMNVRLGKLRHMLLVFALSAVELC
jgi:hypothetical protein